jgi:tetratricopeptide (TPR) repeat protein
VFIRLRPYVMRGILLTLFLGALWGCSQYSSSPGSIAFHNITAKYNAYYIARSEMEAAERAMAKAYKDNYNQLLPILMPLDSILGQQARPQLEGAIKKASIVAERHQNSKWLDDSYTLIGQARLYLGQYDDGVEALRYVFTNGRDEDDKNTALIWLMRAYTEKADYTNALNVAEYLRQQPLSKEATREFYLAKASIHQQLGENLTAVAILEQTFPLLKKNSQTARLHYIAGQLYDRIGQYALADDHYRDVNRNQPSYDLSFYAHMNSLQNRVLLNPKVDLSGVGFDKMLRDRKNNDLRDRIYYTMGLLAERGGAYPDAISYLKKSVQQAGSNTEQVPYTYLELARIHFDRLENYEQAQAYYDSALVTLPKQAELQSLALMNPVALDRKLDVIIEMEEEEKKQLLLRAQEALAASNRPSKADLGTAFISGAGRRWELYDPAMLNQAKVEFRRIWGNRPLEDNWRRASKENSSFAGNTQGGNSTGSSKQLASEPVAAPVTLTKDSEAWLARREDLRKNIPLSEAALASSQKREEDALYRLGKIYRFDLKENSKAVETFSRLLKEYPRTSYREELYYLIYLSLDEKDKNRPIWKEKLLEGFPNSTYTRLLNQTIASGAEKGTLAEGSAPKAYDSIYEQYAAGRYAEALTQVDDALVRYQDSPMADKFALLRIFLIGKVKGRDPYLQAINEFIRLYPGSPLLPRVQEMLEMTGRASIRR